MMVVTFSLTASELINSGAAMRNYFSIFSCKSSKYDQSQKTYSCRKVRICDSAVLFK